MKKIFFLLFLITFSLLQAQEDQNTIDKKTLSLSEQFDELYRKSTAYKEYKVISIKKYNHLKSNSIDSLNTQKKLVAEKDAIIRSNNNKIKNLKQLLADIKESLKQSLELQDQRFFLGIKVKHSVFSFIIIFSYIILIILVGFFAFKYQQNIDSTKKAIQNLENTEHEFEQYKKSALTRFQEVNRKLQDELNKNWKKEN